MAQEEGLVNKIKDYKWIDIICGTHNYHKIPEYINEYLNNGNICEVYSIEGNVYENIPVKRESKYKDRNNSEYERDRKFKEFKYDKYEKENEFKDEKEKIEDNYNKYDRDYSESNSSRRKK